ncbi:MAG: amino acid ABC transporter permease [Elainellaceae cyanobacterium]
MTTATPDQVSSAPPKSSSPGPVEWLRENLFSSWFNTLLTIVVVAILAIAIWSLVGWAFTAAQWRVIPNNLGLFMTGLYPREAYWRIWTLFGLVVTLAGISWGVLTRNSAKLLARPMLIVLGAMCAIIIIIPALFGSEETPALLTPLSATVLVGLVAITVAAAFVGRTVTQNSPGLAQWLPLAWFIAYIAALWLVGGGLGLEGVGTNDWGGLVLTLLLAITGIALCFPIGVVLALGRRSTLPVVRWLSVAYIELVRGTPLIAILFMGQVMIPLFLPEGLRPDRIIRAVIALTLFSSAYLAENVRAGLQSVPRGQTEAAISLGLNKPLTVAFIVLPQALKTAIPAIVGQFISLFQDTTLLATLGLIELLGISQSVLANPNYLGRYAEVYLFIGVIYWFFCYAMSLGSRYVEQQLNTGH